ncbi:EF-P 5-aminopentanol modification-associated protein YfmH [Longirhabdus pacifica]|uniref:EF-P 5-aminopentanol modification-associated protein YfmH n=1 Tax=Longirhabdus pacifica TaxID=2305227 RepID=UPI0010088E62|nr:pitrilysin family protein [Longirhabdus pacifica]
MKIKTYPELKESLFFTKLDNGLDVYVLPKQGYRKTYATFATKYGSIDNHFQVEGKPKIKVPDGIAHFLEHKMFEQPEGDVFAQFATQGASVNAFTSFDRTVYLFSSTEQIEQNVNTLIDFVQTPHFTDENVEKEKGIITQEINMYKDSPDWQVYMGLIQSLFQQHPVHIDIAGTEESIHEITKEMLYDCYHTFYHPSNMCLFVVGGVDAEHVTSLAANNQSAKNIHPQGEIKRYFEAEPKAVKAHEKKIQLSVSMPKCLCGIKEVYGYEEGTSLLQKQLEMKIIMDLLFSPSSTLYQQLYDQQLITDSFSSDYKAYNTFAFSVFGGDTPDPDRMIHMIRSNIDEYIKNGLSKEEFEVSKHKQMGSYLRLFNIPELIAHSFTDYLYKNCDFFDMMSTFSRITWEGINDRLRHHFNWEVMSVSVVERK